jgi:signal transduction histidine kinase
MAFVDDVRRALGAADIATSMPAGLVARWRKVIYVELDGLAGWQLKAAHDQWSLPGAIEAWAGTLWRDLNAGLGSIRTPDQLLQLGDATLRVLVSGSQPPELPPLDTAELRRLVGSFHPDSDFPLHEYLVQLGALDPKSGRRTAIGDLLLGLTGLDAIRWMVAVETSRSLGYGDPWRLAPEVAITFQKYPVVRYDAQDEPRILEDYGLAGLSAVVWKRLSRMGLVFQYGDEDDQDADGWTVTSSGSLIFREVTSDPPSPIVLLARAAAHDTVTAALALPSPQGAIEANRDLSTLVVHELRNKLVPLRAAVDSANADRARRIVEEMDVFVNRIAEFATPAPPLVEIDLRQAVMDAVNGVKAEVNGRLKVTLTLAEVYVAGAEDRVRTAIAQVIRNAAQAGRGEAPVSLEIAVSEHANGALVSFDDDGRGVPPEKRGDIWTRGFSGTGGSGLGLTLVKQIVEGELRGAVAVAESARGGAFFTFLLPASRK